MKEVVIKIKTVQYDNATKLSDVIELVTEAKYFSKNNSEYLVYEESELSGLEGTTTKIKISNNKVELKRIGKHDSTMLFEKDKRFESIMATPMGNIPLEILTNKIVYSKQEEPFKVDLEVEYSISLKGLFQGKNVMKIEVI
ncbi:MAG: DUF1934 domain-containing protein [Proteocatella sp.]